MQRYINFTKFILVFVFLVILAGGIVRTTQSGMGCPDWPRCFGLWVPPTEASQLPPDFEKYLDKQSIDHTFNAFHTWIEYINRLLGALLGTWILIHAAWSFKKFYKSNKSICWLSLFMLLATGFQGWLGKKVVDANLEVFKITIHMLGALVIALIPAIILNKLKQDPRTEDNQLKWLITTALMLVIVQIIAGTDIREQIDAVSRSLNYNNRELWISKLNGLFSLHQTMAAFIALLSMGIFIRSLQYASLKKNAAWLFTSVLSVVLLGLIIAYFNIPAFAQPLHLLFSSILFIVLFVFRLRIK